MGVTDCPYERPRSATPSYPHQISLTPVFRDNRLSRAADSSTTREPTRCASRLIVGRFLGYLWMPPASLYSMIETTERTII
ncbi:unnamed protein product [Vitrella brassicaformis CCMP3155]|uniref:Uncharacterized protein n=1 Tax=Vitrella brassicaformis (strain CCMP3155) TaxID=1169540 RepID=A0A0G4H4I8_VITBC|nr:unnamed protein product [Vitrella brassicaformis CCMP3155]|eukprot:CEM38696.1 unnamed protein product [Vitrella brassicaformis CCMP3155]